MRDNTSFQLTDLSVQEVAIAKQKVEKYRAEQAAKAASIALWKPVLAELQEAGPDAAEPFLARIHALDDSDAEWAETDLICLINGLVELLQLRPRQRNGSTHLAR
jgi:hypothetical protein